MIRIESLAGRFGQFASAVLGRQLRADGGGLDRLMRLAWDVRDTIQDVHLRLRYGKAERQPDLSEPTEPAALPDTPSVSFRDRIRGRIADRRRDDEDPGWRPPRPW